jgi:hypothetical protein
MQRFELAGVCVLLALLAAGCGAADGMTDISGTVTFDGQPVAEGAITFSPLDGKSPTAGAQIEQGQYKARVPVGEMKVEITMPKVVGTKKIYDTPDSPVMPVTEEGLPAKYNKESELKVSVSPGQNQKDWPLKK